MKRWSLLLVCAALSARAEEFPKLGVLDFQANGTSEQLASAASGVAANEIERLGLFKVITSEAIRSLVALERQKQLLGCSDEGCMAELSGALGIQYGVNGKVSRIEGKGGMPTTFTLEMTLLDVTKARREGSDVQTAQSEAELLGKVGRGVVKILGKILEGRSGHLVVSASEGGAVVKVDDVVVGSTPLAGKLPLPGGPHFLVVEKEGFVAHQKQIRVDPAQTTEEQVTLIPSADYVREYEGRANRMRLGAWISTGVGVAAAGGAGVLWFRSSRLYGSPQAAGTFAYYQAKLYAGIETEGQVNYRTAAQQLKAQIQTFDLLGNIGVGVAAAGALAAGCFFIAGEDPGRYVKYHDTAVRPKVTLLPVPGGAVGLVSAAF